MILPVMQTVGEFLSDCGRRLAPFERPRVGRVGCIVALAALAAALLALSLGLKETGGSWAAGFRFMVLCALGGVILLFVGYAAVEMIAERSVWRRVEQYIGQSGTDLETLLNAAEMRRTHIPGGSRLVALLNGRRQARR